MTLESLGFITRHPDEVVANARTFRPKRLLTYPGCEQGSRFPSWAASLFLAALTT